MGSPHSEIFENLTIFTRRLEVSANEASFTADHKIWLKIELQKIGHFFQRKIHRFEGIFQGMEVPRYSSVVVFEAANANQVKQEVTSCFDRK